MIYQTVDNASQLRAHIGQASPVWEVREFGQPVGYVEDWTALCWFAQTGEGLTPYNRA